MVLIGLLALAGYSAWLAPHAPTGQQSWIVGAIFAAALLSSIAGFAFPAICGAILFHVVNDPIRVVQIMMVCGAAGQLLMVWSLRRHIVWRELAPYLLGAAIGLPIGLYVLLNTNRALYVSAVGVLLIAYALFRIFQRPFVVRNQRVAFDIAVGMLGGITGGAAALPSAFVTIWCSCKGWSKERQRGIYQPFILCVQLAAITSMVLIGPSAGRPVPFDFSGVAYLPAMILGVTLGMSFFKRMNDRQFALAVNLLLIASGMSFVL
ncbi:MAG: sulfite exporter TauE/SafE family protein [Alphaproteobacteria bacterium]|nr:sulfite exporter TauE/SafE family protein [Alphaproteobacteria bacterium]